LPLSFFDEIELFFTSGGVNFVAFVFFVIKLPLVWKFGAIPLSLPVKLPLLVGLPYYLLFCSVLLKLSKLLSYLFHRIFQIFANFSKFNIFFWMSNDLAFWVFGLELFTFFWIFQNLLNLFEFFKFSLKMFNSIDCKLYIFVYFCLEYLISTLYYLCLLLFSLFKFFLFWLQKAGLTRRWQHRQCRWSMVPLSFFFPSNFVTNQKEAVFSFKFFYKKTTI